MGGCGDAGEAGGGLEARLFETEADEVSAGPGGVFVTEGADLAPIDIESGEPAGDPIDIGGLNTRLAVGEEAVWATDVNEHEAARTDLSGGSRQALAVPGGDPVAVAALGSGALVASGRELIPYAAGGSPGPASRLPSGRRAWIGALYTATMCKSIWAMDSPSLSGDVLAQPTRARIFAWPVDHRRAAGTAEVAGAVGGTRTACGGTSNGCRRRAWSSGSGAEGGRGRPGDRWLVASGARPGGARPGGYADLAGWLARLLPAGSRRLREIEKVGREIGRELAPAESREPVEGFRQAIAALGLQPVLEARGDGDFTCRLVSRGPGERAPFP